MKSFRAPRSTVEMRQATVHRKDNSARFKEMEKWMDKNVTGEGAKTSPVQKSKTRRGPKGQGNQDKEVHSIPCRKGIKLKYIQFPVVFTWSSLENNFPIRTLRCLAH